MRAIACFLLVCAWALVFVGCSPDSAWDRSAGVTAPVSPRLEEGTAPVIGSNGGTVSDGYSVLTVPSGALSNTLAVTMTTSFVTGGLARCDLGPSGQKLAVSATLDLPLPSNSQQSFRIIRYDPVTGGWTDMGGQSSNGRIVTQISDFSRYQVDVID